ncbi:hypothetical protein ACFL4T_14430 [candidate division KSB1 bacterium]
MKIIKYLSVSVLVLFFISGCNFRLNKSYRINDGRTTGGKNTINGHITIGSDCFVKGSCRSVNGSIRIGRLSKVRALQTVNGGIDLHRDVEVKGDLESVNGGITCDNGVKVYGSVNTINGRVDLSGTTVDYNVSTYNGDILLLQRSIVRGDIIVKRNRGKSRRWREMKIEISGDSRVEGDIIIKDRDIDVVVYLSGDGKVLGNIDPRAEVIQK